jgi:hypothetical protein
MVTFCPIAVRLGHWNADGNVSGEAGGPRLPDVPLAVAVAAFTANF